jgi:hypothetical protein
MMLCGAGCAPLRFAYELLRLLDARRRRRGRNDDVRRCGVDAARQLSLSVPVEVLPARHDGVALCNLRVRVNPGTAGARTTSQSIDNGIAVRELHRRELHVPLTRASRALLAPVPPSV